MRVGNNVIVFNEISGEWLCLIKIINKHAIFVEKLKILREFQSTKKVWLAFCPVKPEHNKLIVEKCTELGVTDFLPLKSEYTNHTINTEKLQLIARGAAEQCERIDIPLVWPTVTFDEFTKDLSDGIRWISAIARSSTATPLVNIDTTHHECGFIVGPEGGFSEDEKEILMQKTIPCTLSSDILRTETAAISCISVCAAKHTAYTQTS
jgi:16S rRNA (uracil1498-N3)-methyltransferase